MIITIKHFWTIVWYDTNSLQHTLRRYIEIVIANGIGTDLKNSKNYF